MNESATIPTPASAQAEDARKAGAEPLNGNGFYTLQDRRLPGDRDLGWLWANPGRADLCYEHL
jgi:hypothetical protein